MIEVKPISSRDGITKFIKFNYKLYKNCKYSVPDLAMDMRNTFNPKKNAGLEFSDVQLFLAYRDGKVVGRVAAIINRRANEKWNTRVVRFGWIDFIDDLEVCAALLRAVETWGRERGMDEIQGPLGITDMDKEGMLTEGFDKMGSVLTIYNYPYYPRFMDALGYEKKAEWMELKVTVPNSIPEKYSKVTKIVMSRNNLRVKKLKSHSQFVKEGYGQKLFKLVNEAYSGLFGYSELSTRQIDQYVREFLPLIDLDLVTFIEDGNTGETVAFGACMPSLADAMRKSGGKLLPFGWFHLLKALKMKRCYEDTVNLMLIAVKPEYQSKGVNAPIFNDLIPHFQRLGFRYAMVCPMLETNSKVLAQWEYFDYEIAKRRKCYGKHIED